MKIKLVDIRVEAISLNGHVVKAGLLDIGSHYPDDGIIYIDGEPCNVKTVTLTIPDQKDEAPNE